jgi:phospho-N-acetylmuramoyl-pentapeptide-transferase
MSKLLGILLLSFTTTFVLAVPFINLLYKLKFQRQRESGQKNIFGEVTSIVNRLHNWKVGTPNAGGILIILVSIFFSAIFYGLTKFEINWTANILYFTMLSFGTLGLYDDARKFFGYKQSGVWGLRIRYKFALQWLIALVVGLALYVQMDLHTLMLPLGYEIDLGSFYPVFAALVIVATVNAVNLTDGLDGLANGLLIIALAAFWLLATYTQLGDVTVFIAVMMGSLLAFHYFNIFPARVWMGDTGALALGGMLAVIALILNQVFVLPFIGVVFMIETLTTLIQWTSKALRGKKVFIATPIHHHFEAKGWDETKVTMRFWLAGGVGAFVGLFVALIGK